MHERVLMQNHCPVNSGLVEVVEDGKRTYSRRGTRAAQDLGLTKLWPQVHERDQ